MNPPPRLSAAAGFILAGGQSSRMGMDKALALFNGIPLIQNALTILSATGLTSRIAGSRSQLGAFAEEIPDTWSSAGPLGGIYSALSVSHAEWNLFLPVDMPLMPPSLLACLLQRASLTGVPVTVVKLNGRIEPFPVVLHRSTLRIIQERLQAGESGCHTAWQAIPEALGSILDATPVEHLSQCGQCRHPLNLPPRLWFQSSNTSADLVYLNSVSARPDQGQINKPRLPRSQVI